MDFWTSNLSHYCANGATYPEISTYLFFDIRRFNDSQAHYRKK
jgi:hypothetical protein